MAPVPALPFSSPLTVVDKVREGVVAELATVPAKPLAVLTATDVTVPFPVPAPIAERNEAASSAETVLSAFILGNAMAEGSVNVKKFAPTVVAPRLVRAAEAVVAPVPPLAIVKAVPLQLLLLIVLMWLVNPGPDWFSPW
jgi:hypothetical protein